MGTIRTMVGQLAVFAAVLAGTVLSAAAGSRERVTEYPHVALTNGPVTLTALLPDAEQGYYRGPRFDWSGMVGQVEYAGHTWFGPVSMPHDPLAGEGAIGTAEEFGMGINGLPAPLGYQEAKVGEPFLKIGVGLLTKPAENLYRFGWAYEIVQPGQWQAQSGPTWVEYRQEMSLGPWGYAYTKRIDLLADGPGFAVQHLLRNTGARTLEQGHYCHNFFSMDGEAIDQRYAVRFPFLPQAERDLGDKAQLIGRSLFMSRALPGEAVFTELAGFQGTPEENGFIIENRHTRTGVKVQGDLPVARFNFWSGSAAICPEPFVLLKLEPGQAVTWTNTYALIVRDRDQQRRGESNRSADSS